MRCLIVADLHYSLPQFDWLVSAAPHFDLVIFAGDALDVGSMVDFRAQIIVVQKYLSILAGVTRIVLCSGNHDLDERSPEGEKVSKWIAEAGRLGIVCDGDSFTMNGILFTVCPWWDGPLVKEKIAAQLAGAATTRVAKWVWIHHAPPANSPISWGGARHFGDVELVQWIEQYRPDMVVSGHVHQSPFVRSGSWYDRLGQTWVFNAGRQFGRPPVHMVLDFDNDDAFWISADSAQVVNLAQPLVRPAPPIVTPPDWLISLNRISDPNLARLPPATG